MALRNIRNNKIDNNILRKKAKVVTIIDDRILTLLEDMVETMYKEDGIGLAAPQVGILKRIIVIDIGDGPIKLINPRIVEQSGEQLAIEACLSVPDISGQVKRPESVCVTALNEKNECIEIQGKGLLARVLCHEIDHLDGVLFIDKMNTNT
jgi:peptide deformylase